MYSPTVHRLCAVICLTFVCTTHRVAAATDYDELEAQGVQLLHNGSFERADREGSAPDGWGVVKEARDKLKLVTNPKESKHGAAYVTFAPSKLRGLWGRLQSFPHGKCRITAWAKGDGKVGFGIGAVRKNWRSLPVKQKMLASKGSPRFRIQSHEWRRVSWDFDLADTYTKDGKTEKTDMTSFSIRVSGKISLDQCSIVPVAVLDAAAATAQAPVDTTDLRPLMTIPKIGKPPVLDGKIDEEEWSRAAAVTGFTMLNSQQWSSRQATVFAGFGDQKLYIAFRCPHEGRIELEKGGRDALGTQQSQGIEIWLQPPGGQWHQFLGLPGEVIVDVSQEDHFDWNGRWEFKEQIRDVAEEIGGILSFRKKLWTAEIAIPFEDLGVSTPVDGQKWRINFTRDYGVPKGRKRSHDDWTTWSPIRGRFKELKAFGTAEMGSDAPAVQFRELGDLGNGDLSVKGTCSGREDVRISVRAAFADTGKTLSFKSIDVPAGSSVPFELADTLKVNETTQLVYHITATDKASGRLLSAQKIPFTAIAALRVTAIPVFSKDTLFLNADARRVAGLPETIVVEGELFAGGVATGRTAKATWPSGQLAGDVAIPIGGLAPGQYQAKVFLKDRQGGEALVGSLASFTIPEPPSWLGNKLGMTDRVPAPWTPVAVDGRRVRITQREYVLGDTGLPRQVIALGQELFAAPPRLSAMVNGRRVDWRMEPAKLLGRTDRDATWQVTGKAGPLSLSGKLTVEFDGFALWEFSVSSAGRVTVDGLALEFPFHKVRSLYARGKDSTLDDRGSFAGLLDGAGPIEDVIIAGGHFCGAGWIWPKQWCHEIWVGDDERGLSVMCETREHLKGERRTEVERTASANVLRIHLIDGPSDIQGSLPYRYMWQATPVKPKPVAKMWHATYQRSALIKALEDGRERNRIHIGLHMWALKYEGYPQHFLSRRKVEQLNKVLLDGGTKMVPYSGTNLVTTEVPELWPYRAEWEGRPSRIGSNPRGGWFVSCPFTPSLRDFKVDCMKRMVDDLGFGGLYLDVSGATACRNHYHGCGYRDAESGEWQPTVPVLACRRLYQRLYVVNKSNGRDAVLFRHGLPVAAVAGYVDVVTQGEDWCREGDKQYDELTPEIFRAREMRIQYGTPYTWYCFHHYYRGERHGGRIPLSTTLAYCLPHWTLPTEGHMGMWPVWDVTDPFWTDSEFLPYWSPQCPVRTGDKDVVATAYLKRGEREALVVIANWATTTRSTEVQVDLARMGFDPARVRIARALEHPILGPGDRPEGDLMQNTSLVLRGGRMTLELHGRNLEVLRLTQP